MAGISLYFRVVDRRTPLHRSRGSPFADSGRGDLRSAPSGRLHEAVLLIPAIATINLRNCYY